MDPFGGVSRLYGESARNRFSSSRVAVIGVGGVGCWTVEALARSGIGHLTMVDLDEICVSNRNRQLQALIGEEGRMKTRVLAERVARIDPGCEVSVEECFFTEGTVNRILGGEDERRFDAVVDAIDSLNHKITLLLTCRRRGIPLIVSGGAGGRRDPTQIRIGDLSKTRNDALLATMRKQLRQRHGFPREGRGRFKVACVSSEEPAVYPDGSGGVCENPESKREMRLNCDYGFGTATPVVATFGMAMASWVLDLLAGESTR